jgi:hypothetical protein
MDAKRKSGTKSGAKRNRNRSVDWVTSVCRFADAVEQQGARMRHPRMQQVQVAINLLSQVVQDVDWVRVNDPHKYVERVLELLIEMSMPRSSDHVR